MSRPPATPTITILENGDRPGFKWRGAHDPVTLIDVGQTRFRVVDIVVK